MAQDNIVIFNIRIAKEIIQQNRFELVDITTNVKDRSKIVMLFKKTDELLELLGKKYGIHIK